MNRIIKLLLITIVFLSVACNKESLINGGDEPVFSPRELLLTFKNDFSFPEKDLPGDSLPEDLLASLDIYVFGSLTEDGLYTFLQRFAYRQHPGELPEGATVLALEAKENGFDTSLKLKRGLFVKYYCIANQTRLMNPADETEPVADTAFVPLQLREDKAGRVVASEGEPKEPAFLTFHTPLIDPALEQDTLVPPVPMAGNCQAPLDLTDLEADTPIRAELQLTRLLARLDISNHAAVSGFTLETLTLKNGRQGSYFFPIQVYGAQPEAASGELALYPLRPFSGAKANAGIRTGAFYCYPSPFLDQAALVLSGKYLSKEGKAEDITYEIPFRQQADGNYIEVMNNRRYMLSITGADARQLFYVFQATLWENGQEPDSPTPAASEFLVTIPAAFEGNTQWDKASTTLRMAFDEASTVSLSTQSQAVLQVTKSYAGGNPGYDWLDLSHALVTPTKALPAYSYTYTLSLNKNYRQGRYPKATLHFIDTSSGTESLFFVEALTGLQLVPTAGNPNRVDADTQTAYLARLPQSSLQAKYLCPDGVEVESKPGWLDVDRVSEENGESLFLLTLTDPYVAEEEGGLTFRNKKRPAEIKTDLRVRLQDAVTPSFASLEGTENLFAPASGESVADVCMQIKEENVFTVAVSSLGGTAVTLDFSGGPAWLDAAVEPVGNSLGYASENCIFSLIPDKLAGAKKAVVTLQPEGGGFGYRFTVTPSFRYGKVQKEGTSVPGDDQIEGTAITMYKLLEEVSSMQIRVISYGGSKLSYFGSGLSFPAVMENRANEAVYTLTATDAGTGTLRIMNYTDNTKFADYQVTVMLRGDSSIHLPAGTVPVALEPGTEAAKTGISSLKGFTVDAADIQWGSGGNAWFDLTVTDVEGGTGKSVGIRVKNTLPVVGSAQEATVVLKNKAPGGGDASFTVTPHWVAPTNGAAQPLSFTVNVGASAEIRLQPPYPYGGVHVTPGSGNGVSCQPLDEASGMIILKGLAARDAEIKVANGQDNSRSISYRVKVTEIAPDKIRTVNGVKWAVGNLVRQDVNSCTIGSSTEAGLYFKWGALSGYDATNPDCAVKPNAYVSVTGFTGSPSANTVIGNDLPAEGTGDPCRYYLGETWRLPTKSEYEGLGLADYEWTVEGETGGVKTGAAKELFFPLNGLRYHGSDDPVQYKATNGYYWTSVFMGDPNAYGLFFQKNNKPYVGNGHRENGCAVRCVQEP